MTGRVAVLGVGHPFRRDDGLGPEVLAAARSRLPAPVTVHELDGEATRIVDAWTGADLAVVVDALRTGAPPGTIHELDGPGPALAARVARHEPWVAGGGSHALGVGAAIRLGQALDRLPARLVVLGVEPADTGAGPGLTPPVRAAVPDVVDRVVEAATRALAERARGGGG